MRRISLFVFIAALFAVVGHAQQSSSIHIKVDRTRVDNGKQMFVSYCAPCHGVDGRGHGPVAAALQTPPTDLTQLSKNHNGQYPEDHIVAVLHFGVENAAHGSKLMPIWGPIFYRLDHTPGSTTLQTLRISNVVEYIKTLQQ